MKFTIDATAEQLALFAAYCEQQLTLPQRVHLQRLLRDDREARRAFLAYCHLNAELQRLGEVAGLTEWAQASSAPPSDAVPEEGTAPAAMVPPHIPGMRRVSPSWLTLLAGAAAVLLVAAALWAWRTQNQLSPDALAEVVAIENIGGWQGSTAPLAGQQLAAANLAWQSGTLKLASRHGSQFTVSGPAQLIWKRHGEVELQRGTLQARIVSRDVGFKVATPSCEVVDLGTEFTVTVAAAGETQVQVAQGSVEVFSSGSASSPGKTTTAKTRQVLRKGQSVVVKPAAATKKLIAGTSSHTFKLPPLAKVDSSKPLQVRYRLPTDVPNATYHVTLAAAPADKPEWLVSTFVASQSRQVTAENGGEFADVWDGLDDNGMPVPPGNYVIRGIYLPAQAWEIQNQSRAIAPKYLMGVGDSWSPPAGQGHQPIIPAGHQFGFMSDIATHDSGKAAFFSHYIESGNNPFLVDLHREIGYDQVLQTFSSFGGSEGGPAVAFDGHHVWTCSSSGWLMRGDRAWGADKSAIGVAGVQLPAPAHSLVAHTDNAGARRLYVALVAKADGQPVNEVRCYDGDTAALLGTVPLETPRAVFLDKRHPTERLLALHKTVAGGWAISAVPLQGGVPQGEWQQQFVLEGVLDPYDCDMASDGTYYVVDASGDCVRHLDAAGKLIAQWGQPNQRQAGPFRTDRFFKPTRVATWLKAGEGQDRVLVLENGLTGRISEWLADGTFVRQWFLSRGAVNGACVDPEEPTHMYFPAEGGMMRFAIDYKHNTWQPDAVYPDLKLGVGIYPQIVHFKGRKYLCFAGGQSSGQNYSIYRWDNNRWVPSAAVIWSKSRGEDKPGGYWWHDANNDGEIQDDELSEYADHPVYANWWGDRWLEKLCLVTGMPQDAGEPAWPRRGFRRLAPRKFDEHGNPIFSPADLKPLLEDTIHVQRVREIANPGLQPRLGALEGGNEEASVWHAGWTTADGEPGGDFYVHGGFGPPNPGGIDMGGARTTHEKLTRYQKQPDGSYTMQWRVGRKAWRAAQLGELYSTFRLTKPVYGIVGIQDQNGLYHLFSDQGYFIDTLMWDGFARGGQFNNQYSHGGEMWFGCHYLNKQNGKVYLVMGRSAANIYECVGWQADAAKPLEVLDAHVPLVASQISKPNEFALAARGGVGKAKVARFVPAPGGGPALDGTLTGWESVTPIAFGLDDARRAEVRTMYDAEHLYLRWHVRTPTPAVVPAKADLKRMFTHNVAADTLSFYLQGDPQAPASLEEARAGDVRFVFGYRPVAGKLEVPVLAMYATALEDLKSPQSITYRSPVRKATFADVRVLDDLAAQCIPDEDRQGFVLTAVIPRRYLPKSLPAFNGDLSTQVNFSVTLAGTTPFWWANSRGVTNTLVTDEPAEAMFYPGSWTQARFEPITTLPVRSWLYCGPWGGRELTNTPAGWNEGHAFAKNLFETTVYPLDQQPFNLADVFKSDQTIDYAGNQHEVKWQVVSTTGDRVLLGANERKLFYLTTWIYSPTETTVGMEVIAPAGLFGGNRMQINGQQLSTATSNDYGIAGRQTNATELPLKAGWNQVNLRCYYLWNPFHAGLILRGPEELLWQLKFATEPPK